MKYREIMTTGEYRYCARQGADMMTKEAQGLVQNLADIGIDAGMLIAVTAGVPLGVAYNYMNSNLKKEDLGIQTRQLELDHYNNAADELEAELNITQGM